MVRYTTLAEGMIEGAIAPDQVSIRLHDDVEEKITKNIMSYIKKGETLGDEEFDTLLTFSMISSMCVFGFSLLPS